MQPFVQSYKNFHSIHILVRKTKKYLSFSFNWHSQGAAGVDCPRQPGAAGAKNDSKASRAMPSAAATQTHSTRRDKWVWWCLSDPRNSSVCQTRLQQRGTMSTQAGRSECQDHHPSSSATPERREEGGLIYTRLLTAHPYSLNINLIHGYTGVSYYS